MEGKDGKESVLDIDLQGIHMALGVNDLHTTEKGIPLVNGKSDRVEKY